MATTSHKTRIKASRSRIFQAIATAKGLKCWYTPHVEGEVAEGREAIFRFSGRKPFRWQFAEITPDSQVRWECPEGPGGREGNYSHVSLDGRRRWANRGRMPPRGLAGVA
jgi:hypothetical protein